MSQPMEPFESQNVTDDDGQVIDSFLIETSNPPPLRDAQEPILVRALAEPAPITRIFSKDQLIGVSWEPVQILPADAKRKSLNVYVYSPTSVATDGIRFSDEKGSVLTTAGKILHNGTIDLSGHTGPVWVVATGNGTDNAASAPVTIQYWSVSA